MAIEAVEGLSELLSPEMRARWALGHGASLEEVDVVGF